MKRLIAWTHAAATTLSFATFALGATAAHAQLGAATVTSNCFNYGVLIQASGNCANGGTTVTGSLNGGPNLEAIATAGSPASATGYLDYNFAVTGGNYGDTVLIDVLAYMTWDRAAPDGTALAEITIDSGVQSTYAAICSGACGGPGRDGVNYYYGTLQLLAQVGMQGSVQMLAQAGSGNAGLGETHVYLDPLFTIDASNPNAGQYGFAFSPGVVQGVTIPGVPEPASWALMAGGFGVIGGAMRSRRRATDRFA